MNKKVILIIIMIMSTALVGLAVIQFTWIRWQVDLNEKAFEDKVTMVLNQVKQRVQEDFKKKEESTEQFTFKSNMRKPIVNKILNPEKEDFRTRQLRKEFSSTSFYLDPKKKLENIDKDKLDIYIKDELANQGIDIVHDYGVYSNQNEGFLIVNGNFYVGEIGGSSNIEDSDQSSLYNSNYSISLFNTDTKSPGSLKIFFKNKAGYLWSKVLWSLASSIIFISLILFCFSYVVWVIFQQKKVSEMKTDFINNMTHEFKTPIATISLATDSITSDKIIHNEGKIKRFAGIIKQENKRMLNQVEKVLQMATIDKEDFKLRVSQLDLHELIEQAARNMSLKVDQRNGSLTQDLSAAHYLIEGDQNHISNILHNLLDNAEKYSPESPEISISTKNVKDGIQITVSDKGIGMSKDALKNIFDKFYRVHTGNRHDVKGFGLGLSYVKALVTAHNGSIKVSSEPGKGSSFKLILPFRH